MLGKKTNQEYKKIAENVLVSPTRRSEICPTFQSSEKQVGKAYIFSYRCNFNLGRHMFNIF
jgi:hypothetical protein